jgi:hypothetical protein
MPEGVTASDGDHDKYVLIRWDPTEGAQKYRVYRSTSPKSATMQEVTKSWQNSTWFCDYGVSRGVDYYYAVMSSNGTVSSALSQTDKGFIRKEDARANNTDLSDIREMAAPPKPVMIETVKTTADTYAAGDTVSVSFDLRNMTQTATPAAQVRIFLSNDVELDWDDKELSKKTYSALPANGTIVLKEKVVLPQPLLAGTYNLIAVISIEGRILKSEIGVTQITVGP